MQKQIGWFWMIGFFGLVATADAQTASPPAANTQCDGTYGFVSSTGVNETYAVTGSNRIGQCRKMLKVGPLTIVNAQARFSSGASGQNLYEGRANSQGELAMRSAEPTPHGEWAGVGSERMVFGRIQGDGRVHARQKFAL